MLHEYQLYAIRFLLNNPIAALFLDMGLGKTVIVLSAISELLKHDVTKILVVAPLRVARDTWIAEAKKWAHLSSITIVSATGSEKQRIAALRLRYDVTCINRENIPWLAKYMKHNKYCRYDMLVIDELSSFKNRQAERSKALLAIRIICQRVVGLTGTPSPNTLMDLWMPFRILDLGVRLGRFITKFREQYFLPDDRNGEVIYSWKVRNGAEDEIYSKISDITISMKAVEHLKMPDKIINTIYAELDAREKSIYDKLKKDMIAEVTKGEPITAMNAGVLAGKLQQLSSGAIYRRNGEVDVLHNRKLDILEDLIESALGGSLMIVYWYKHSLMRIQERFPNVVKLDASDSMANWNAGRIRLAAIHPASAGHGLNLQAGGHVMIWFDIPWSLELYQQTLARLWRQGQDSTVVVYHIITKGCIDETILQVLTDKEYRQNALLDAVRKDIYE